MFRFEIKNTFVEQLPVDPIADNHRRQVLGACSSLVQPATVANPSLVAFSKEVAELCGIDLASVESGEFLQLFSGNKLSSKMQPYAMCYGGHQFGNWAGQLGDGRAINLGELVTEHGLQTLQLKGAGATPYSRTADGLAVLRSSIREFLCCEAMFHLGVPTTRALSLVNTGEQVMRDMLYDGNAEFEPGAVVCRVAPSFIRFGNFQILAARDEIDLLKQLADYTIHHYFSELETEYQQGSKECYVAWFNQVCDLTRAMIVEWMRVGFVHGVMNTDNMSIHGLTIDYGPYGWLDNYDPEWTPNTTDAEHRRYRYSQQPNIALWNLYQLANSLYPLIEQTEPLEAALENFQSSYFEQYRAMQSTKLGFDQSSEVPDKLLTDLEHILVDQETDMTLFYRQLAKDETPSYQSLMPSYYQPEQHDEASKQITEKWLSDYQQAIKSNGVDFKKRQQRMNQVNPKFVFRNYLAQQAIDKAEQGDNSMVNELLEVLRNPYQEQPEFEQYAAKRPDWAKTKVGCSMLSCSS